MIQARDACGNAGCVWPSGSPRWVLCDVVLPLDAGQTEKATVVAGPGASDEPDLAGENFQNRGWISASLEPLAFFHTARVLDDSEFKDLARGRMIDLVQWTRVELFPWFADADQRHLVYSYAVSQQVVVDWEQYDFHPILFGMAETFAETQDVRFLMKGVEQIQAFEAHDTGPFDTNLYLLDNRLECQHFMHAFMEWVLTLPPL
jgi:hypothetical protein